MKRQWCVRRGTVERPDARQRWAWVYQSILRWTLESGPTSGLSANGEEEYHVGSSLHPGFDPGAGQAPDDWAATRDDSRIRAGEGLGTIGRECLPRRRLQRGD